MAKKSTKSNASTTDTSSDKQQAPPAGEPTPVDTQATSSLPTPEARTGVVSGGLSDEEQKAAVERVEGRTSDAANRSEKVNAADVPPDINEGAKPSDGGPDLYPFPTGGDVDIATVPDKQRKGEKTPPIPVGAWVRLGKHEDVPERLEGRIAYVTDSPTQLCNCDWAPRTHEHQAENVGITVKTRDEVGATLTLPREAFSEVSFDGRHGVAAYG